MSSKVTSYSNNLVESENKYLDSQSSSIQGRKVSSNNSSSMADLLGIDQATLNKIPALNQLLQSVQFSSTESDVKLDGDRFILPKADIEARIEQEKRTLYGQAKVENFAEYQEKSKQISRLKDTARNQFFTGRENIRMMQEIDFAMAKAAGVMNPANRQVIENYWEMVQRIGLKFHEQCISKFSILFASFDIPKPTTGDEIPTDAKYYVQVLKQYAEQMNSSYSKKLQALESKQKKLQPEKQQIQDDYLILRAKLMGMAFANMQIRGLAENFYQQHQQYVGHMHKRFVIPQVGKDIENFENLLASDKQQLADLEQGTGLYERMDLELRTKLKPSLLESIKDYEKYLEEWRGYERDTMAYAYQMFGHPDTIRQAVEMSPYERRVCEFLEAQSVLSDNDIERDLKELTVSYFYKKEESRAAAQLAFFKMK